MPRATPVPVRQTILARQQQGQDATAIAQDLQLPVRTVQHLLQRLRQAPAVLPPAYPSGPRPAHPLCETVLDYRRQHPAWGAELIRVQLCRTRDPKDVPCARTLQRWLCRHGLSPAPPGRQPALRRPRAEVPHAVWQMDAAEHLALRGGQEVSWLRLVDECSGAFLKTRVFPPRAVEPGAGAGRA
jgi:hypothetical protein